MKCPVLIFLTLAFAGLQTTSAQTSASPTPTPASAATATPSPTPLHTEVPKHFTKWPDQKKIDYYGESSPEVQQALKADVATAVWRLKCAGKRGFHLHQQRRTIQARGLGDLLRLSELRLQLWDSYAFTTVQEMEQAIQSAQFYQPKTRAREKAEIKAIKREHLAVDHQYWKTYWPLPLHLSPSPQALQLDAQAAKILKNLKKGIPSGPALKALLAQMDEQADAFIAEMRNLPALTSAQLKQEIAALPPEEIHP